MAIRLDPQRDEPRALFEMEDFGGKEVLEIGSGDGRLTWLYAERAKHVTAVEQFTPSINRAQNDLPSELAGRVEFHNTAFLAYADRTGPGAFDSIVLSWSF